MLYWKASTWLCSLQEGLYRMPEQMRSKKGYRKVYKYVKIVCRAITLGKTLLKILNYYCENG